MSNKIRTKSFKDKLKTARLPQRSVEVCLRGDLFAEIEELDLELARLVKDEGDERLVGNPRAKELADRIEALRAEMAEETETFTLRAIPGGQLTALQAEFPPRKDDAADARAGYNRDDFMEALLKRSVISPEISEEDWPTLLEVMSQWQYNELVGCAWIVNTGTVSVPFSQAASKVLKSDSESKRPNA